MSRLSFRSKLLLAMMLVVAGVSVATLLITQHRVQQNYERMFRKQFERQIAYVTELQQARLGTIQAQCLRFAQSVRLIAAMDESPIDVASLYKDARAELREVFDEERPGANAGPRRPRATLIRAVDATGQALTPPAVGTPDRIFAAAVNRPLDLKLEFIREALSAPEVQQVGYVGQSLTTNGAGVRQLRPAGEADETEREGLLSLQELIITKIADSATGRVIGALALGFPVPELVAPRLRNARAQTTNVLDTIQTGILIDDALYSSTANIPPALHEQVTALALQHVRTSSRDQADFDCELDGQHYRLFYQLMNAGSVFPPAYQVCLYSLEEARQEQRDLSWKILGSGAVALAIGLMFSLVISQGLSAPIRELVTGTGEIQRGNFQVRVPVRSHDEVGRLASSFNEMAEGLAQKERYRTVLNMVADERVAQELVAGRLALGGEEREISVLFCDIRGFTALTQNMPPAEVIEMLNEHMTALTKVVKTHQGVLDKFVGDLLMAIFGAPVSYGNYTLHAAQCALRMIEVRRQLNQTSRYKLEVGVGVATGTVVAGCMGSADRLNYTVVGERVNLASRLCDMATPGEVLIDDSTREKLADAIEVKPTGEIQLKGFSAPVQAFRLRTVQVEQVQLA